MPQSPRGQTNRRACRDQRPSGRPTGCTCCGQVREHHGETPHKPHPGSLKRGKLRTKRLAQWLAQELTAWEGAVLAIEERLESSDGRIFGTPDLVVRHPAPHRVEDYKTGGVLDDDGVLAERYRRQILIYAHLERDTNGALPSIGVVRRLRGDPIKFEITELPVHAEVEDALGAIDDFNASLSDPEAQARPSERVCCACPYAARCQPFWRAVPSMDPSNIVALGGKLTALHSTDAQGFSIHLEVTEGNTGTHEANVRGIQRPLAPTLAAAELDSHVRIVGLKPAGSTEQSFAPRGMLRVQTQASPQP